MLNAQFPGRAIPGNGSKILPGNHCSCSACLENFNSQVLSEVLVSRGSFVPQKYTISLLLLFSLGSWFSLFLSFCSALSLVLCCGIPIPIPSRGRRRRSGTFASADCCLVPACWFGDLEFCCLLLFYVLCCVTFVDYRQSFVLSNRFVRVLLFYCYTPN